MGNVTKTMPRVVLSDPAQLHFKSLRVTKDVEEVIKAWFEDGAPLGLTPDMFESVFGLRLKNARLVFDAFDNDRNGKVDAFEVLASMVLLAGGSVEEKLDAIFPVFDFGGAGRMNFDEVNILLHSTYRGLQKLCQTARIEDMRIVEECRQMFDSHNLAYEKQITKEQLRRWAKNDIDAARFIDLFQSGYSVPEVEGRLANMEQQQAAAFSELCGGGAASASAPSVAQNDGLHRAFDSPLNQDFEKLVEAMTDNGVVTLDSFAKTARAWNIFSVVDVHAGGFVDAKELGTLLWFHGRQEPTATAVESHLKSMNLQADGRIGRWSWIKTILSGAQ